MNWTRSETLALAQQSCTYCHGLGLCPGRAGTSRPCNCVFRSIFRACYARFRKCANDDGAWVIPTLGRNRGPRHRGGWGLKYQEFAADFVLIARRTLGEDTLAYRVFRFHFLLGADWKLVCRKLGLRRGEFFHEVYRIQQKLGRAFREQEPFALFPLDEYFGGRVDRATRRWTGSDSVFPVEVEREEPAKAKLRFPLAVGA